MPDFIKYPRTRHITGSRFQHGDHDLEAVPWSEIQGKHLVIEEKVDGSQIGISFSEDGELLLQSRGHYLRGGPREKQFELLKQWSNTKHSELFDVLGSRYVMYGEWLYALHTFYYDELPHYFMEFDVFDKEQKVFLSTSARCELLSSTSVVPVLVLKQGKFSKLQHLKDMIKKSNFISDDKLNRQHRFLYEAQESGAIRNNSLTLDEDEWHALRKVDWNPEMEGLYIKWEEDGIVKGRYKFVRDSFTSSIAGQEEHWHDRPIIKNRLSDGAFERMFT